MSGRVLEFTRTPDTPLTDEEVRALIDAVREGLIGLAAASPEQKAIMYKHMGLRLTYHPDRDALEIESRPVVCTRVRVGEGT